MIPANQSLIRALLLLKTRAISSQSELLSTALARNRNLRIQTVNLHHLSLYRSDPEFRPTTADADLFTADGWPVTMALRVAGAQAATVTGSRFMADLLASDLSGYRIALIGASHDAGQLFNERASACGATVVYRNHDSYSTWDPSEISVKLNELGADLALVAVTPPMGEYLAARIHTGGFAGTILNVGGGLNMAVGLQPLAPTWVNRMGVEWLYRLAREPKRLWRRYLVDCVPLVIPLAMAAIAARREQSSE